MEIAGLYIHIPFCVQKCAYCDFLSFASDQETKERYVDSLCEELRAHARNFDRNIGTVFIGGGTPTSLSGELLERIADCILTHFKVMEECEFTIEMNPKTLDERKLKFLEEGPVNRVSIGLQSTVDKHLSQLSRIHTYHDFLDTYKKVKGAGIDNINVDLMFGLPEQTLDEWKGTLDVITELDPPHISAYGLIIEEGTPFYRLYQEGKLQLPDEELERSMYHYTKRYLEEKGIFQYEISNYAKPEFECRHNMAYWTDVDYIGAGLGASSYLEGVRYVNTDDMELYMNCAGDPDRIRVVTGEASDKIRLEEAIFLGLRMNKGIHMESVNRKFDSPFEGVYRKPLEKYLAEGCLIIEDGYLRLTDKGRDLSNRVFSEFLIDEE